MGHTDGSLIALRFSESTYRLRDVYWGWKGGEEGGGKGARIPRIPSIELQH